MSWECGVCSYKNQETNIVYEKYWECQGCASLVLNENKKVEYPKEYFERGKGGGVFDKLLTKLSFWDRYRYLDLNKKSKVLEIGFGSGIFLRELTSRGYQVWGVDDSGYAIENASKYIDSNRLLSPKGFATSKEKFDVVIMFHVLEHIDEPRKILSQILEKLNKQGKIVIRIPNVNSTEARLAKEHWYHRDYPYHKYLLSDKGVESMLKRIGFANIKSRYGLWEYRQVLGDELIYRVFGRVNMLGWVVAQMLIVPIYWLWSIIKKDFGVVEIQAMRKG